MQHAALVIYQIQHDYVVILEVLWFVPKILLYEIAIGHKM